MAATAPTQADAQRLAARVAELEHERKHLLAIIEILKEISGSLHFVDILQAIARKLAKRSGWIAAPSSSRSAAASRCGWWRRTKTRRFATTSSTSSVIPS